MQLSFRSRDCFKDTGFSQGATAAALLLAHLAATEQTPQSLLFAVLVSGFLPLDTKYAQSVWDAGVQLPILIVHGRNDELVPMHRSINLQVALGAYSATISSAISLSRTISIPP